MIKNKYRTFALKFFVHLKGCDDFSWESTELDGMWDHVQTNLDEHDHYENTSPEQA